MTGIVLAAAGLLGLLIGSFLNVVAYRVPAGLSVVRPASACPGCHNEITARDNVPVVSWLLLRGRCRHCDMRISARYPLVELGTAVAFVVAALPFAGALDRVAAPTITAAGVLELVAFLYLAAVSVVLATIDIDVRRLPDVIVLPSYAVGAVLLGGAALLRGDVVPFATAAACSGLAVAAFLALALVKAGGMGLGDIKLAGVLGLFLGYLGVPQVVVGLFAGFLLGAVYGIALIVTRRASRGTAVPFGPWMLGGAWIGVLAGGPLAAAYLGLFGIA